MNVINTSLPGVILIEPRVFTDARGYFFETFQDQRYQSFGIPSTFVQDNFSRSQCNVIRGLHYQLEYPQGKLIWVTRGRVLDVVVDIRVGSPRFGQSLTIELSDANHRQVYIPPGFAHGFCALSEEVDFIYKCTDYYHPPAERGILWSDADLKIAWPISNPIVNEKDQLYPKLKDVSPDQLPRYIA
jgi:dTDP-4-dehydrorhamnose 3,5-epimerase